MKDPTFKNPLALAILNPSNLHDLKAKKILQFTKKGLEILSQYYNHKYSHKPKISLILTELESDEMTFNPEFCNKISDQAIAKIKSVGYHECPKKILLTISKQKNSEELIHSQPFIISSHKLILLNSERDKIAKDIYLKIAEKLNLQFVEPLPSKKFSFQADQISCHMISGAILKDLDQLDVELISTLESNYQISPILAKLLKYSQSSQYNSHILSGTISARVKDNIKLEDYVLNGKSLKFGSKIQEKQQKFLQKTYDLDFSQDSKIIVKKLLESNKTIELTH